MAIRALQSSATGMEANMFKLDTIANNLANAGTTAFKRSRVNFEDLFYEHIRLPGALDQLGQSAPIGQHVGLGSRVAGTEIDQQEGSLLETGKSLDLAITGDGFFQVQNGNEILYTRAGTFTKNRDGEVVLASADRGRLLEPPITIPQDATEVVITSDGFVSVRVAGSQQFTQLGQLELARFVNPQGLIQRGQNLFEQSDASGPPLLGTPGSEGRGELRSGFLETSNVQPVQELVELIKTQRNFELNSQVVQASDQALQLIANLRRF